VTDVTATHRGGSAAGEGGPCRLSADRLHAAAYAPAAHREYVSVRDRGRCPEAKVLEAMGPTLVVRRSWEPKLRRTLLDAVHIDQLNFGCADDPVELAAAAGAI
jgi:hypothetical protein